MTVQPTRHYFFQVAVIREFLVQKFLEVSEQELVTGVQVWTVGWMAELCKTAFLGCGLRTVTLVNWCVVAKQQHPCGQFPTTFLSDCLP